MLCFDHLEWAFWPCGRIMEFFLVSDDLVPTESILGKILKFSLLRAFQKLPTEPDGLPFNRSGDSFHLFKCRYPGNNFQDSVLLHRNHSLF